MEGGQERDDLEALDVGLQPEALAPVGPVRTCTHSR